MKKLLFFSVLLGSVYSTKLIQEEGLLGERLDHQENNVSVELDEPLRSSLVGSGNDPVQPRLDPQQKTDELFELEENIEEMSTENMRPAIELNQITLPIVQVVLEEEPEEIFQGDGDRDRDDLLPQENTDDLFGMGENIQEMNLDNIGFNPTTVPPNQGVKSDDGDDEPVESKLQAPSMSFIDEQVVEAEKAEGAARPSRVNWVLVGLGLTGGAMGVLLLASIGTVIWKIYLPRRKHKGGDITERA